MKGIGRITRLLLPFVLAAFAPDARAETGLPVATGVVTPRKPVTKKPKRKVRRSMPARASARPPEPFVPRVWFATATAADWHLELGQTDLGKEDLFRNLSLRASMRVLHDVGDIRATRTAGIAALRAGIEASGRDADEVAPICGDASAFVFSHWKPKTDTVRVAYREVLLAGERVTLVFTGQWPAWNNPQAAHDFDEMVCAGWVWWETQL